jgi:hypothetical protein
MMEMASGEILARSAKKATYPSRQQISPYGAAFSAFAGDATEMPGRLFLEDYLLYRGGMDGEGMGEGEGQEEERW